MHLLAGMSIPVMSREGGILLAIPSDYIVPHALLDSAVSHDEDALIGPYAEFEASLLEEDEEGNVERVPEKSRYLAIDFSDDILGYLRQYDPVTDPSAVIRPFDPERLEAIVDVKESLEDIRRWLESLGDVPRANFHSAREEPPTPKAAPKKTAKRVTAANLAVQVETLTAQVKMMAKQQQEMLLSHRASVATHAAELPNGGHVAPRLPDASAGLGAPQMPSVPKVAQLVGPPPKNKGHCHICSKPCHTRYRRGAGRHGDAAGPYVQSTSAAVGSPVDPSSSSYNRGCLDRSICSLQQRCWLEYKRRSTKRASTTGAFSGHEQFFCSGTTAVVSKAQPRANRFPRRRKISCWGGPPCASTWKSLAGTRQDQRWVC